MTSASRSASAAPAHDASVDNNALGLDSMWAAPSSSAPHGSPSLPSYYGFGSAGAYGYGEGVAPHEQGPSSFDAPAASGAHGGYDGTIAGPATSMGGLWPAFTPGAALPQSWERSSFNSASSVLAKALELPHLINGRGSDASVASLDSSIATTDTTGPITPAEGLRRSSYQMPIFTPADTASTTETAMSLFPATPEAPKRAISGPAVGSPHQRGSPHFSSTAQSAPSYPSFSYGSPHQGLPPPHIRPPLTSQQASPAPSFTDPWAGFRSQHARAGSAESTGDPIHGSPMTGYRQLHSLDEVSANSSPYLGHGSPQLGSMPPPLLGRRPYSRVGSFDSPVRNQLQSMQLQRTASPDEDGYDSSHGAPSVYTGMGIDLPILSDVDMRDTIHRFIDAPNKLVHGERTVLIMSARVGQKSYGSEKRWCYESNPHANGHGYGRIVRPDVTISVSGDSNPMQAAQVDWTSSTGDRVGSTGPDPECLIAGRAVAKALYIPNVDDRTKLVSAIVDVSLTDPISRTTLHVGQWSSRPIRVVSKPSKKRQAPSRASELTIGHGSLVSMYNRIRSQTISTRYLCVSGVASNFPTYDWRFLNGDESRPFEQSTTANGACFVARTNAWDPYVIYVVDPLKAAHGPNVEPLMPSVPYLPRPPANALPVPDGQAATIFYNQPVVLQCIATAVVSPVMIIRQVDRTSTALGGGKPDGGPARTAGSGRGDTPTPLTTEDGRVPVAPGETLGDPVSQLQKVAFEVLTNPIGSYAAAAQQSVPDLIAGFPGANQFLSCMGEVVGIHHAQAQRIPVGSTPSTPSLTPTSAATSSSYSSGSGSGGSSSWFAPPPHGFPGANNGNGNGDFDPAFPYGGTAPANPARHSNAQAALYGRTRASSASVAGLSSPDMSADGGKVRKTPRRVSSSAGLHGEPTAGGRRRGSSLSSANSPFPAGHPYAAPAASATAAAAGSGAAAVLEWSIDCSEQCVWTIAGIDIVRHTFFVPAPPQHMVANIAGPTSSPAPEVPVQVAPVIHRWDLPRAFSPTDQVDEDTLCTVYGEGFFQDLQVWFGDTKSPDVFIQSPGLLRCTIPSGIETPCSIILARPDGVLYRQAGSFSFQNAA